MVQLSVGSFTPLVVKSDDRVANPTITNNTLLVPVNNNSNIEINMSSETNDEPLEN